MVRVNSGGSRDGRSARDSLNRMAGSNRLAASKPPPGSAEAAASPLVGAKASSISP